MEAIALLLKEDFDVVLTDQKMAGGSGLDVLRAVQENDATTSVIFLTAVGTLELAVESMRLGAFDFFTKPYVLDVMLASNETRLRAHSICSVRMRFSEPPYENLKAPMRLPERARASVLFARSVHALLEPTQQF